MYNDTTLYYYSKTPYESYDCGIRIAHVLCLKKKKLPGVAFNRLARCTMRWWPGGIHHRFRLRRTGEFGNVYIIIMGSTWQRYRAQSYGSINVPSVRLKTFVL